MVRGVVWRCPKNHTGHIAELFSATISRIFLSGPSIVKTLYFSFTLLSFFFFKSSEFYSSADNYFMPLNQQHLGISIGGFSSLQLVIYLKAIQTFTLNTASWISNMTFAEANDFKAHEWGGQGYILPKMQSALLWVLEQLDWISTEWLISQCVSSLISPGKRQWFLLFGYTKINTAVMCSPCVKEQRLFKTIISKNAALVHPKP